MNRSCLGFGFSANQTDAPSVTRPKIRIGHIPHPPSIKNSIIAVSPSRLVGLFPRRLLLRPAWSSQRGGAGSVTKNRRNRERLPINIHVVTRGALARYAGVDTDNAAAPSDAELAARLRRRDPRAFDAVYDRFHPRLFSFLVRLA